MRRRPDPMAGRRFARAVGKLIRLERTRRGLSVAELAKRVDRFESDVRRWELGYHAPSSSLLQQIARAIGCSADALLPDDEAA